MHERTLRRLTVTLAMLSMAVFMLAGCGASASAASSTTTAPTERARLAASATRQINVPIVLSSANNLPPKDVSVTFGVVGDSGTRGQAEKQVAQMVAGWKPAFILDTGDVYYARAGGSTTDKYDRSVGIYYCDYVKDITTTGPDCPHGKAAVNRFFPTAGNHEYSDAGIENYLAYFDLPGKGFQNSSGNERYYDFTWGPVHFFAVNSNTMEPDGASPDSKQGQWLKKGLAASTSAWNIVFFHHPPYSSGANHGDSPWMQWPFKAWGVTAVLSGHEHVYERLLRDGVAYFVNGAGGGDLYAFRKQPDAGSQVRITGKWGAQKVIATDKKITFEYYTVDGKLADSYTIEK